MGTRVISQPAQTFVGRRDETNACELLLERVAKGEMAALGLSADPGMGKSRLLGEVGARAEQRGNLVLTGSASELEREMPFSVFVDALDDYLHGLEPGRLAALEDADRAQLAHVFPSFDARPAATGVQIQDERFRTHRAVRRLLELLAQARPLCLILDDIHWADGATIELLGSLLRSPPAAAVLIAVALRPRQLPMRLSALLERAIGDGVMTRLELGALSAAEAQELLGDALDRRAASALYEASGGNPFYLQQLARSGFSAAFDARGAEGISLSGVEVPWAVAAALTGELGLLPRRTRRVLDGAAVAGDPFEPELAAAAAGTSEREALEELDVLLERDLVRSTAMPRRFRFRHPLVRAAVYQFAPGGWRVGAHERCAQALTARGAPAAERAHHVERSARQGDQDAVEVLIEAARAAVERAPASAAHLYAAALKILPATAPVTERIELLAALAEAESTAGRFGEAHAAVLEGLKLLGREESAVRLRLTARCALLESLLGHHQQAHGRLRGALDGLANPSSTEAFELMLVLQLDGFYRRDYASMRDWAERALSLAKSLGDRSRTAAAASTLVLANLLVSDIDAARSLRDEAAILVTELTDAELALHLDAGANLARAELYLDHYAEAGALAERTLAAARATGQGDVFPVPYWVGTIRLMRGRLLAAAELLDAAVEAARLPGHPAVLGWSLMSRSMAATAAGDTATALSCGEESLEVARQLGAGPLVPLCGAAVAAALLANGEPQRAVAELIATAGGDELTDIPGPWRINYLELLTRCALALGRTADAGRAAERADALATALGLRLPRAMADRALAAVALESGDAAAAAARALESADTADAVGAAVEGALSRTLAGRALGQSGDRKRAASELQRAAASLEECGALGHRDAAERELGRLGARPHRRTRPGRDGAGIDALTGRELDVARLIADGRTNPQIAAELFLSPKTVETHIRNIFVKLSVSSRVQVALVVQRADGGDRRPPMRP